MASTSMPNMPTPKPYLPSTNSNYGVAMSAGSSLTHYVTPFANDAKFTGTPYSNISGMSGGAPSGGSVAAVEKLGGAHLAAGSVGGDVTVCLLV
jgi:hypothetical protein